MNILPGLQAGLDAEIIKNVLPFKRRVSYCVLDINAI